MGRSIGAVVVGFLYAVAFFWLAQAVLWFCLPDVGEPGDDTTEATPASRLALTVACAFASAALAGFVTAHVAGREGLAHGLALGAVLLVLLGVTTLVVQPEPAPPWYQLALPAVTLPATLLGAYLRTRLRRPPPTPPKTP
jgi:hypothetical protein